MVSNDSPPKWHAEALDLGLDLSVSSVYLNAHWQWRSGLTWFLRIFSLRLSRPIDGKRVDRSWLRCHRV